MSRTRAVRVGSVTIGGGAPLALIGGPCAIENEKHALMVAERLQRTTADAGVPFIYKSSYDKANRSSIHSYRGPGLEEGLRILRKVKEETGLAGALRRARRLRGRPRRRGARRAPDPRVPLPPDRPDRGVRDGAAGR